VALNTITHPLTLLSVHVAGFIQTTIYIIMKYLVLHVAGFIQTTIHVTIDDLFQKCTRYFLNNK
jgi:hypothetical protein